MISTRLATLPLTFTIRPSELLVWVKSDPKMAKRAIGFSMNVLYFNRNKRDEEFGASYVDSLEELLERSDYVSLHNPLTPETMNMMSTVQFKLMKKISYFDQHDSWCGCRSGCFVRGT